MNRAFSLVEVVVTISILIVVIGAVSMFQYNVLNYNRSSATSLTNISEAQSIVKVMAKEMRSMVPSSNGSYPILAAATSTVTFYSDIDIDGVKEQVRYYLGSTTATRNTLYRGYLKPTGSPPSYSGTESTKILATGIRNGTSSPLFKYFGTSYAGTTSPMTYPLTLTTVRLIQVDLTIDSDPAKSPITRTFSTQVSLRNLKDNL